MANRRMFSLHIVDTDAFLDMPSGSQLLYFHLAMRADDDGFVGNPKKIARTIGASDDDIKVLLAKRFLLSFDSGIIVIKHWRMHNYLRKDTYNETRYVEEKSKLLLKENGAYTERRRPVDGSLTQVSIGKVSIGKVSTDKDSEVATNVAAPKDVATDFFSGGETYIEIRNTLIERIPEQSVDRELRKFVSYWTEPNKTGTKERWQLQQTFDVKRRLHTWLERAAQDYQKKTFAKGKGLIK